MPLKNRKRFTALVRQIGGCMSHWWLQFENSPDPWRDVRLIIEFALDQCRDRVRFPTGLPILLRDVRSLVSGEFHKLLPLCLEGSNPSPATNFETPSDSHGDAKQPQSV